jgi:hypothetical protein
MVRAIERGDKVEIRGFRQFPHPVTRGPRGASSQNRRASRSAGETNSVLQTQQGTAQPREETLNTRFAKKLSGAKFCAVIGVSRYRTKPARAFFEGGHQEACQ